jgi:hypothetical protein
MSLKMTYLIVQGSRTVISTPFRRMWTQKIQAL